MFRSKKIDIAEAYQILGVNEKTPWEEVLKVRSCVRAFVRITALSEQQRDTAETLTPAITPACPPASHPAVLTHSLARACASLSLFLSLSVRV